MTENEMFEKLMAAHERCLTCRHMVYEGDGELSCATEVGPRNGVRTPDGRGYYASVGYVASRATSAHPGSMLARHTPVAAAKPPCGCYQRAVE